MTAFVRRSVYAAAHVVADSSGHDVDWDETLAVREHLWSLGFGVAEAMDTAQRGSGLDWPRAAELMRRTSAAAPAGAGWLACGVSTDQLSGEVELDDVLAAYQEQLEFVEATTAQPVIMASRALAAVARSADDYYAIYGRLLEQATRPVILHWLGGAFDPALEAYWGSTDLDVATDTVLALVKEHAGKVHGIKLSLLDADREVSLRRSLPGGVRMFTGDDFHYPELICGDSDGYSDALLGVLGAIAVPAAAALRALDAGDLDEYEARLRPTVPLAQHLFQRPTYNYKTGIAFLAYLNGQQSRFSMLGRAEAARDLAHLRTAYDLALGAGALVDPDGARRRLDIAVRELGGTR